LKIKALFSNIDVRQIKKYDKDSVFHIPVLVLFPASEVVPPCGKISEAVVGAASAATSNDAAVANYRN